jgi:uncharacterized protein with HEPN domain
MPRKRGDPLSDRVRLEHMCVAARDAIRFVQGRTRADLNRDRMLLRALINCVQEIGEAASQISAGARARAPTLPWAAIIGMRHILVHAYYDVDADAVWRVVAEIYRCSSAAWSPC